MAFEAIGLPADGAGKKLAARKSTGQGPSGADVYLEVLLVAPENAVGYVVQSQPLAAVPTVLTSVFSLTVHLERLVLVNTTSSSIAVQVVDGSGSDVELLSDGLLVPGKTTIILPFDIALTGGMKWKAASSGVNGAAKGYSAS